MQPTGNGAGGQHRSNGGYSGAKTVGFVRARGGRLHQPAALDDTVWSSEPQNTADCWGVWRLDVQRLPTLGRLQGSDVWAPNCP